jgi:hypothetical protein
LPYGAPCSVRIRTPIALSAFLRIAGSIGRQILALIFDVRLWNEPRSAFLHQLDGLGVQHRAVFDGRDAGTNGSKDSFGSVRVCRHMQTMALCFLHASPELSLRILLRTYGRVERQYFPCRAYLDPYDRHR